ncbi:MAG TPA: hypothetical protein VGI81_15380 [Tepidisphaeraceae bacterium]|jgi:hypothetical protein
MAANAVPQRDSTRFVAMFQKAHSHLAALQRVDEQIAALFEQRRKAIEDLRAVQAMINSEFARVLELGRVLPADTLAQGEDILADAAKVSMELKPSGPPPNREQQRNGSARAPALQATGA